MSSIETIIASELNIKESQVIAVMRLLDDGATVPFIARYRKEATGGLDDSQLRTLNSRLEYLRTLNERREVILKAIKEQERLTPELEKALLEARTKVRLEDLYLPYRIKRQTRAYIATQTGLAPLADTLLTEPNIIIEDEARKYINLELGINNIEEAIEGASQILMERFADNADVLHYSRQYSWNNAIIQAKELKGQSKQAYKYADYFKYAEPIRKIPSHRALALLRGRKERALQLKFVMPENDNNIIQYIINHFQIKHQTNDPSFTWIMNVINTAYISKLLSKLETDAFSNLREIADHEAIRIFTNNLRDLLLTAPAGAKTILGLDPGIRTGVKAAVIDITGQVLDYATVFPLAPQNEWHESIATLAKLVAKYNVDLISIGNGTGSRETERLISDLIKMYPDLALTKVLVNEAGASVYSASELASRELPELDVSIRGAVSIARRLQDPLAELVKIEPKSIGVGQYQHDVNQTLLNNSLNDVVEYCVNAVGVDLNLASPALLTHIAGLNETLAKNIIEYRNINGPFKNREQLKLVARMGEKTFQQSAGFLRISGGDNPLDATGIHPEAYAIVEKIILDRKTSSHIELADYVNNEYSLAAIQELVQELDKPARDPRPTFKAFDFKEGIEELAHLKEGMILDGIVSNVTHFGIFVNIGVHQDGLVHISEMTDKFIKDPQLIVKVGEMITVKILNVDVPKKRISLSMKLSEKPVVKKAPKTNTIKQSTINNKNIVKPKIEKKPVIFNTAMADALSKLKR